jgi:predicted transcriptional regulator
LNDRPTLTQLTTDVVAAYLENSKLAPSEVAPLIHSVHATLHALDAGAPASLSPASLTAAQVRKSITSDGLVSFEDGRRYKHLKRHLAARGLTPVEYRAKWGLPADYPLVSPAYSAARSAIAKAAGFGKTSKTSPAESSAAEPPKTRIRGKLSLFGRDLKTTA